MSETTVTCPDRFCGQEVQPGEDGLLPDHDDIGGELCVQSRHPAPSEIEAPR